MVRPFLIFCGMLVLGVIADYAFDAFVQLILIYLLINMILGMSLNLVNGFTGQFSLGHAGFMALGAYTSALLSTQFTDLSGPRGLIAFPLFALAGGCVAGIAGWFVGQPSLRLRGDYLAIVTLGFGEIIRVMLLNTPAVGGARGFYGIAGPTDWNLGGFVIDKFLIGYSMAMFWVVVCFFFIWRLIRSAHGRAFLSVREDEIAAEAMGINTTQAKVRAFVLSSFFAGVAGSIFAHYANYLNPASFGFNRSIDAVIMVVLGGMGSLTGSLLAAVFVTIMPELLRPLQELLGVDLRMVIYALSLVLLMILRPKGLFGSRELPDLLGSMAENLLEARQITMQFGGLKAVDGLQFSVKAGELMGLIGPNGAGKTTVFNMLTGVYRPTTGEVVFRDQVLNGKKPYQIARLGMTRTFQNIRLFRDLTVLENVLVGYSHRVRYGMAAPVLQTALFKRDEKESQDHAVELLSIFGLADKKDAPASGLPYGEQRKLEIVRALATDPQLICLDEPAAGMNHNETHQLMDLIAKIRRDFKLTVLLIEHDMKLVMGICERIVVLDHGVKIEEGPPAVIQKSQKVIEAYLGAEEA